VTTAPPNALSARSAGLLDEPDQRADSCELSSCGLRAARAGRVECLIFCRYRRSRVVAARFDAMSFATAARRIAERQHEGREPRLEVLHCSSP